MNTDNYIQLERQFSPFSKNDSDEVVDSVLSQLDLHDFKTWPDLLEEYRTVILAEAGAGKTEEFQQ